MKKTTFFKPSIHGWPFGNSFEYTFLSPVGDITLTMGFCGGMCWTTLDRFYAGTRMTRDAPAPVLGDPFYSEISNSQLASLDPAKILKIYEWQSSPKLDHWENIHSSLGQKTKPEWVNTRALLDNSKPVTLTLIRFSNDYWPGNLVYNHRVIAIGYETRHLYDGEYVHGERNPHIRHVTLSIYDPNYPDDDDVSLTFYTNCDHSWMRLKHSKGDQVTGFFVDDKIRSYESTDSTTLQIHGIERKEIVSADWAAYDLAFSWRCRIIPYFCIEIDNVPWQHNTQVQAQYLPNTDKTHKQCATTEGSMTVNLSLPRALTKVAVRLLDSDDHERTDWVADPVPEIDCYPYIRSRDAGGSHVCDTAIEEEDLYIRDPDPSSDAVQGLNTSPSRWIEMSFPNRTSASDEIGWAWQDDTDTGPSLQIDTCTIMSKRMLGNVVAPVYANFVEKNLAPPVQTSGLVRTIRNGQVVSTSQISSLARQGQKIFDGFKDNPGDYDDDTTVEFTYRFEDKFGAVAQGQVSFHGRSIISCRQRLFSISYEQAPADPMNRPVRFDSPDILRLEAIARDLIEREIVDFAIEVKRSSSSGRPLFPPGREPEPIDPVALTKRLRSDRRLLQHVDRSFKTVWRDPALWGASWKTQSRILKQVVQDRRALLDEPKTGDLMLAASQLREEEQQEFDSVIISMFAQRTMGRLRRDQTVIDRLRSL